MDLVRTEQEWAERAKRYLKAELKHANVTYDDLATRLARHGMTETKASIAKSCGWRTFSHRLRLAGLIDRSTTRRRNANRQQGR